jgi:alpha-2-macroglobulin
VPRTHSPWLPLLFSVVTTAPPALAEPADRLEVTMSGCAQAGCQLVFHFSHPMATEELPRLRLDPPQKGSTRWTGAAELTFTPEAGALSWGSAVSVQLEAPGLSKPWSTSFTVPYFEVAGKVAAWPVVPGQPRFVAVLGGRQQIGRGPLYLLYDQEVDPRAVARHLRVRDAEGKPVAVRVFRPHAVQGYDGPLDRAVVIGVRLVHPPRSGTQLTLAVPGYVEGKREVAEHFFEVLTDFRLQAPAPMGRVPLALRLQLSSTTPVSGEALRRAMVVTPKPEHFYVHGNDRELRAGGTLEPGVSYRLEVPKGFADALGNRLGKAFVLRFRAQDLAPALQLPDGPLVVERGGARLPIQGTNIGAVRASLRRFDSPAAFAAALAASSCNGASAEIAHQARGRGAGALNEKKVQDLPLSRVKPGLYCVDISAEGIGSERGDAMTGSMLVQVSNLGATAKTSPGKVLAWITCLDEPRPLRGARVEVIDANGRRYGSAIAGRDGIALLDAPATVEGVARPLFLVVQHRGDAAVLQLSNDRLSQPWKFGLQGETAARPLTASVFTDRGVYRPGETAHVKVIVRDPETFRLPKEGAAAVAVQDARGQKVMEKQLALDMLGSAELEVPIKEGAAVGEYSLRVTQGESSAVRRFHVEEYRVPTFEVTLTAQEQEWKPGDEIHVTAEAKYLHGGTLGGRAAKWQVSADRAPFAPAAFPGFRFGAPRDETGGGPVANGEGKLDGAGRIAFSFRIDAAARGAPVRYTIEATVTDLDRQAYAGRLARVVHPAALYVGVREPGERVMPSREVLDVPVVAVRPDGTAQEGVEVRVVLSRIDYHTVARLSGGSVQHLSRPVHGEGEECLAVTTRTGATCRFLIAESGEHAVTARAEDASHRAAESGFSFVASGEGAAAWPRFDRERVELIADRPSYAPGDVARLVVQTPYTSARGLLTLEQGGVLEHRLVRIDGDTPAIEVKIEESHAPNVFASLVLLRGRVHGEKDAAGQETGAPGFRIGYANLRVEPTGHRLSVKVDPSVRTAAPGEKLSISLHVAEASKRSAAKALPAPAAQATVMVVDEAVLGLTRHRTPDPIAEIFSPRPLAVRTGESRLELFANRRRRHEQIFPAGDGGEGFSPQDFPADVRSLFRSTAYWNAAVPVDEQGDAHVELTLPDNLTTWRVMAVAYDKDGRAGSADAKVVVRKPVMVAPVLPRFVYPGDTLELSAQVFNGTDSAGEAEVQASFEGVEWKPGEARRRLQLEAGKSGVSAWPVKVNGRGRVLVKYAAKIGAHADAVEVTLPILVPGNRRVVVAQRQIAGSGELAVAFPADRQPGTAKAEIVVSSTSLSSLKDAVGYLMEYPNGCIEQTTSTAYPLVMLKDLLPEIGVTVDEADLKKFSEGGVKRILSFQTEKGGLSYWPGGTEPHAFATAFGLTALIEAKKRGYDVPDDKLARMADFLEWSLKQGKISGQMPHAALADADTRALFVLTLGRLGRPQSQWVNTLWRSKEGLTPFGLALLAVAVKELPGDHALLQPLLAEVQKASRQDQSEAWYDGARKGGWSMDSPLRTHAGALLAFAEGGHESEMGPKLLQGLLHRQQGGMWGNTQENVFGIMGVAAFAARAGVSAEAPRMELRLGERRFLPQDLEALSKRVRRLSLTERELDLREGELRPRLENHGMPLFFTVRGEYELQLTAKNRAPRSNGFSVARASALLDGTSLQARDVPLGQLIRVRLRVHAAEAQNYVAIDDKLPAGLEPLNAGLATTETVAQGKPTPELERGLAVLSYSEIRDSRVAFFADELPAGDYEFDYLARATTAGHFLRPPASVEAMYRPEKSGTTALDEVTVQ